MVSVINYEQCTECGACIEKCSHGVYREESAPRPVVVDPEGCVEGSRDAAFSAPAAPSSISEILRRSRPDAVTTRPAAVTTRTRETAAAD